MMKLLKKIALLALILCLGIGISHTTEAGAKKKVALNKTKLTMTAGKTYKLKLKNNKKKVKWSSSKKKIASVTSKGKITAKKAGNAVITAKAAGEKYKCKVTVKAKKATSKKNRDFTKTLQPEPQNKPDYQANYEKLKNYIQLYGVTNSSGNKLLNGSLMYKTMETNYGIVYDAANQKFDFILTNDTALDDGDTALGALVLSVSEASLASGAASYKIVYDSGYYGSVHGTYMLSDFHSADNALLWDLEEADLENTPELANLSLDLGYACWSDLLADTPLGLSLTDLGFGA